MSKRSAFNGAKQTERIKAWLEKQKKNKQTNKRLISGDKQMDAGLGSLNWAWALLLGFNCKMNF